MRRSAESDAAGAQKLIDAVERAKASRQPSSTIIPSPRASAASAFKTDCESTLVIVR
jgi:hypothetical protein